MATGILFMGKCRDMMITLSCFNLQLVGIYNLQLAFSSLPFPILKAQACLEHHPVTFKDRRCVNITNTSTRRSIFVILILIFHPNHYIHQIIIICITWNFGNATRYALRYALVSSCMYMITLCMLYLLDEMQMSNYFLHIHITLQPIISMPSLIPQAA